MENIDIVDELGNKTGEVKSREEVHEKGLLHKTVHIFVINNKKDILMQKRSLEKKTNPNKWTTSASGHLSAGDESREGAVRELYEEIGVKANEEELKYLFTIYEEGKHENLIDREVVDVYLIKRDMELNEFKLQKEEVSDVHWVQLEEFKKLIKNCEANDIVPHYEMFEKIADIVTNI
ncbi:MAG: NUDIX domain-containing protein [Clostridia bacterium]|nr:NUDIX domain-containing protein [Clostridia bacterium]